MNDVLKSVVSGIIGIAGFLVGEFDGLYKALLMLIIADYITGVIVAVVKKQLSSEVGAKGIAKKILMLIVVAVANVLDVQIIGGGAGLRNITIIFYAANEVISLLENTGKLGLPYPPKLLDVLEQVKNKEK
ncbi:MAG: phage holin family protein [Oscillospiraceae bacterium]|nr:phage holin family protein [Oscillospiraceae bacterium]